MDEENGNEEVKSMPKNNKPQAPNPEPEPEQEIDLSAFVTKQKESKALEAPEQDTDDNK